MQGEKWAGRQEGGGEEETEKPGDVTVKGNTTVIQVVFIPLICHFYYTGKIFGE